MKVRTTISIDAGLKARIKAAAAQQCMSFEEALEKCASCGIHALEEPWDDLKVGLFWETRLADGTIERRRILAL